MDFLFYNPSPLCYNSNIQNNYPFHPVKETVTICCWFYSGNISELLCHAGTQAGITGSDIPAVFYI